MDQSRLHVKHPAASFATISFSGFGRTPRAVAVDRVLQPRHRLTGFSILLRAVDGASVCNSPNEARCGCSRAAIASAAHLFEPFSIVGNIWVCAMAWGLNHRW